MKRILITSQHSYIGCKLKEWIRERDRGYEVECVSVRNVDITQTDFSKYDTVIHIAGLVHKKEKPDMWENYYKSNVQLTVELAKKVKQDGGSYFIFMSSMSIYGIKEGKITERTLIEPKSFYGKTKYLAEQQLMEIADSGFQIAIVRPPMVYGENCPGNYGLLAKLAHISPIFPLVENERSMIYIDNLCEFLYQIISQQRSGFFMPQNEEYVQTSRLVKEIAKKRGHQLIQSKICGRIIMHIREKSAFVQKIFGSLTYDKKLSQYEGITYQIVDFEKSVEKTELYNKKNR